MENDKFQNKYRILSARLHNWNYANEGAYFITVCTKDRTHYFGEIKNERMQLSSIGVIADLMRYEIKNHTKNIELGEFVVVPNHIRSILILNDDNVLPHAETRHSLLSLHAYR
jgi:putative transposase